MPVASLSTGGERLTILRCTAAISRTPNTNSPHTNSTSTNTKTRLTPALRPSLAVSLLRFVTLRARLQVSAAFRIEVLSEVPGMSQRAVARLAKKLDEAAKTGNSIEIGEEMRRLTLQV